MRTRIATTLFCALAFAAVLGNGNDDDFYDNPHVDSLEAAALAKEQARVEALQAEIARARKKIDLRAAIEKPPVQFKSNLPEGFWRNAEEAWIKNLGKRNEWGNIRHAAGGGEVQKDQPVLVGERGPEVIVPQKSAIVLPTWKGGQGDRTQADAGYLVAPRPEAWDRWLADLPESTNVQDLRTPQQKIEDNELWRVTWDPIFENPYESWWYDKNRVQFPPAEEKPKPTKTSDTGKATPNLPDWLKDQESQWLKSDRAKKLRER